MKLNDYQIKLIDRNITRSGVTIHSLRNDLLDHICCSIEDKMDAGLDFRQSYIESFMVFGNSGLRKIQKETEFEIHNKHSIYSALAFILNFIMNWLYFFGSIAFVLVPLIFANFANDIKVAFYFMPFTLFGIYILLYGINYKEFKLNYLY